jgi:membrane protease YdiL (CAAX protease family)
MVGIFEELIFRGYMHTFISRYTKSSFAIVVISAVAFGLIHWSLGLHAVLITSTIGAVFMIAYLRTRSLPALMLAHFAVNFIDFAGIIPKSIFTFL